MIFFVISEKTFLRCVFADVTFITLVLKRRKGWKGGEAGVVTVMLGVQLLQKRAGSVRHTTQPG